MSFLKKMKENKFEIKVIPELEGRLNELKDEELIDLGYTVVDVAFLTLRILPPSEPNSSLFWCVRISDASHNITRKLQEKSTVHLKEELIKAIEVLYSCSNKLVEKGFANTTLEIDAHLEK